MNEREISPAEQMDAKLALHAMRRHDALWRTAQGRMRRTEAIGLLLSLLLVAVGLLELGRNQGFLEFLDANEGLGFLLFGVALLGTFLWSHTQRQLNALLELVKQLEVERRRG